MQAIEQLKNTLEIMPDHPEGYFFTLADLRATLPELSSGAFKTLLSRATKKNLLKRVCRGIYTDTNNKPTGLELYHIAARLRAHEFNYISLESVLSDAGVISQIPLQWITLMSSGRSQIIDCGDMGRIEFIHTKKKPANLVDQLDYDKRHHLWRATVKLALEDMKHTQRNLDLIDWSVVDELI